jgi:hypothetical protein
VLLDCDGVLADFFSGALRLFDFDPALYPADQPLLWKGIAVSEAAFNDRIRQTPGFWEHLPAYPWTAGIVAAMNHLRQTRSIDWQIVIGPGVVPDAREQRERWLHQHVGRDFSRFRMGEGKVKRATPVTLIVDDNPNVCQAFERAGGQALLFPSRTNGRMVAEPLEWFRRELRGKLMGAGASVEAREDLGFEVERAVT